MAAASCGRHPPATRLQARVRGPPRLADGRSDRAAEVGRPLRETLHLLHDVPDETLHALYDGAAFCLYPSAYEGFGLPIVEAFLRGKAVLASTGGAIPEVAAGLAPCLDPDDAGAWQTMLARWISDPAVATAHATEIRRRFRHVSWSEAAERFFAAVENAPRRAERRDVVEKAPVP
ncbi:MAG: glycosyltransferase [Xanthobacteraceae bacterium]|nr:glycosyltransferase [Xanthobacteraceae bacterium]